MEREVKTQLAYAPNMPFIRDVHLRKLLGDDEFSGVANQNWNPATNLFYCLRMPNINGYCKLYSAVVRCQNAARNDNRNFAMRPYKLGSTGEPTTAIGDYVSTAWGATTYTPYEWVFPNAVALSPDDTAIGVVFIVEAVATSTQGTVLMNQYGAYRELARNWTLKDACIKGTRSGAYSSALFPDTFALSSGSWSSDATGPACIEWAACFRPL